MFEWSEEHLMMRSALRQFVESEIVPDLDDYEHGGRPPYDVLRKMLCTFGIDVAAREAFARRLERESAGRPAEAGSEGRADPALALIPTIELSRHCPGMVTALGVSVGLTASAINSRGTPEQRRRWVPDLLGLSKVGAWAITEPGSGSDAFGSMLSTARREGDGYVINGSKTFITNGPYADVVVCYCKLDEGNPPPERKVLGFVLEKGMAGLEQSRPVRKMGMHSSPTGDLFLDDVRAGRDRLIGETEEVTAGGRGAAKATFAQERVGVAGMALGMIERCLELCLVHARERVQFGRPIGEFQLVQDKLARMEVARLNVTNLVFRHLEMAAAGRSLSLAEASALKLYSARAAAEVTTEAVQLFGGSGYMSELRVEQLARDARVLQIYGGTDEIQITRIAADLLRAPRAAVETGSLLG